MPCIETARRLHSIIARNGFSVKRGADDRSRSFSRTGMIKGGVGIYTSGSTRMAIELGVSYQPKLSNSISRNLAMASLYEIARDRIAAAHRPVADTALRERADAAL